MKQKNISRLVAISSLSFSITLVTNVLEPGVLGHKVLELSPPNLHNTLLGYSTFAGSILSIIALPLIGVLSDRTKSIFGRRMPYFIIGCLWLIGVLYLIAYSQNVYMLGAAIVLYYLSSNTIFTPWMALYPDLIPQNQRGQASGIRALMDILGLILGRLIAGQILSRIDIMGQMAVTITVTFPVIALLFSLGLTWKAIKGEITTKPPPNKESLLNAVRNTFKVDLRSYPAFKWWFVNRFLFWSAFTTLGTFLLFYTIDVIGLEEAEAQRYLGTMAMIIGGAILVIAAPAGRLADKIGRKPLIVTSGFLAVTGTAYILLVRDLQLLMIGGFIIGAAAGIFISASFALISDIVPRENAGHYLGLAGVASASGSAFARLLGGSIVDRLNMFFNSDSVGYLILYAFAGVLFFLSAITAMSIPVPLSNQKGD